MINTKLAENIAEHIYASGYNSNMNRMTKMVQNYKLWKENCCVCIWVTI